MAGIFGWIQENWFSIVQCIGIVGGLLFTAIALRRDARSRRLSDLLTLSEHHRDLWGEMHRRPDLGRILNSEVDLLSDPITKVEEQFLFTAINHFHTGWYAASVGSLITLDVMAEDMKWFFNLPIPKAVWEATKIGRDPQFVAFVEKARRTRKRKSASSSKG